MHIEIKCDNIQEAGTQQKKLQEKYPDDTFTIQIIGNTTYLIGEVDDEEKIDI